MTPEVRNKNDKTDESLLAKFKCIYCGGTADLEAVSGDGGYGQPKAYACKDVIGCFDRQGKY